jgi:hypothetical protein
MFMSAAKVQHMLEYYLEDVKQDASNLRDDVAKLKKKNKTLTEEISTLRGKVGVLEGLRERKESDEPWVELMGGDIDPEKGLQMQLDWNDAFIDQLRAKGYKGTSEGSLVAEWLLTVSNTVKPQDSDQ